jgi:hypothetical protein
LVPLGRSKVDHTTVEGADPQGVISDAYVAQDFAQVHPDELPSLDGAYFLRYLYLRGRLRRCEGGSFTLGARVSAPKPVIGLAFWAAHAIYIFSFLPL